MNHPERDFTKQVLAYAKLKGWRTAHFRPGMMANGHWITAVSGDGKGFPDLILARCSRLIAAELKVKNGRVSEEQSLWLEALGAAGVETYLWMPCHWSDIEVVLD